MEIMFFIGFFTGIVFTAFVVIAVFYAVTTMFGIDFSKKKEDIEDLSSGAVIIIIMIKLNIGSILLTDQVLMEIKF